MIGKLLTEHHLEFQSFKGGCRGSFESTLVEMLHCWKSHAAAHFIMVSKPVFECFDFWVNNRCFSKLKHELL